MKKYIVERQDIETGKWLTISDTGPAYQMRECARGWWLWRHEYGVIDNLREAEAEAEENAIALARGLSRLGPTRVTCKTKLASGDTSEVISEWKHSKYGRLLQSLRL